MRSPFSKQRSYRSGSDKVQWLLRAAALLGLLLGLILATPITAWWSTSLASPWGAASRGTLVVLNASAIDSSKAGARLTDTGYWSAIYAIRTWRDGVFDKLVIIGRPDAAEIETFVRSGGIPAERIIVTESAHDTRMAAGVIARHASEFPAPLAVLTSDFHVPMARQAFRSAGLSPQIIPFPDGIKRGQPLSWYRHLTVFSDLVREWARQIRSP